MQSFPTPKPLRTSEPTELVAYVDASWNLQSVSGGIVTDHPEDVLAKAGRAGHVFCRGGVGCHG